VLRLVQRAFTVFAATNVCKGTGGLLYSQQQNYAGGPVVCFATFLLHVRVGQPRLVPWEEAARVAAEAAAGGGRSTNTPLADWQDHTGTGGAQSAKSKTGHTTSTQSQALRVSADRNAGENAGGVDEAHSSVPGRRMLLSSTAGWL